MRFAKTAWVCFLLAGALPSANAMDPSAFLVGFSKADITPTQKMFDSGMVINLGGYLPNRSATGVHSPIYARVMVVSEAGSQDAQTVAIANLDLPGISNRYIAEIRKQVSSVVPIPAENILVGATHSHSGPDMQGLWGGVADAYALYLQMQTAQAIIAAYQSREKAHLYVSQGTHFNGNRRGWGFSDQEVTVLDAKRIQDDKRIGTLVNFAAHPVLEDQHSRLIGTDFPGPLVSALEQSLGGSAVYVNGIVGDVTPAYPKNGYEGAALYGRSVAAAAEDSLSKQVKISTGEIHFSGGSWKQPISNKTFLAAYWLGFLKYDGIEGDWMSLKFNVGTSLVRFGREVQMAVFPGESLTRNGMPIKSEMKAPYKMFLGLMGDTLGYFVPTDEWNTGRHNNYEETVSMHKAVGDKARDTLLKLVREDNAKF